MLFDIPYIADWTKIGQRRQTLVNKDVDRHNKKRIDYDYAIGDKVYYLMMVFIANWKINSPAPM